MKASIKATGEIVEVNQCSILYDDGRRELMYGKELEEVQGAPDYWTRLEHTYAGMAMQGILSNPELFKATAKNAEEFGLIVPQAVAIDANCFAHALVEKLKEKEVILTQEQIDTMVHESCVLFCKHCGCGVPRETCTSLGTCKGHDDYRKSIRTHFEKHKK